MSEFGSIEHLQMHLQYESNLQLVQSGVKLYSRRQSHVKLTELKTNFHSLVACKCHSPAVMSLFFPYKDMHLGAFSNLLRTESRGDEIGSQFSFPINKQSLKQKSVTKLLPK